MLTFRQNRPTALKPVSAPHARRWVRGLAWLVALLFAVAASVVALSVIQ
ncbi:MAG TPA: hypothetical protein VIH25_05260 [Steroidobacteraceae bacterium]